MIDLSVFLNKSIQNLAGNALKLCVKNPPMAAYLMRLNGTISKAQKIRATHEKSGLHIPPFLIASITQSCNLRCTGCYAHANGCAHTPSKELSPARWRELFHEAAAIGVSFILLAGGEPLLRRDLLELAGEFPEIVFPVFTNGTMLDEAYLRLFQKHRNLVPVLSIEGGRQATDLRRGDGVYDRLTDGMTKLEANGIFYGASVTVTRDNMGEVTGGDFITTLTGRGCGLVFYVEYVPADETSTALAPTAADRAYLLTCAKTLRDKHRMMFLCFPGDESLVGGCLAAGRGFFHIASDGGAEPCPFSPFSQLNLADHSLTDVLQSGFFRELNEGGLMAMPHDGGCALFANRAEVAQAANNGER